MPDPHTGSCLCGGVAFSVAGPMREIIACHCEQCRKTSGHHVAATNAPASALTLTSEETLTWHVSSDQAKRGFCNRCGGNLFWRRRGSDTISIFAGTLDDTSDLTLKRHIFVKYKAEYMTLPEGCEAFEESF